MATFYLDYEGGNDNYGGTSFALRASGTDGRISSTTFSAATASFPNDGSLINQYLSIFNGTIYAVYQITAWVSSTSLTIAAISGGTALADQTVDRQYYVGGRWKTLTSGATAVRINAGDTLRLMGSPAPTSLGMTGTWTSGSLSGTTAISAATNASPIAITSTAHGLTTGDTVVVTGVGGNSAANGTWEVTVTGANTFTLDGSTGNGAYTSGGAVRKRTNTRVKLASAVTQNIASTGSRSSWTAVAGGNVATSLNITTKEHQYSDSISIGAGFTTGLAAYYPTGTLDLSGYQQVSFWILQATGTIGAAASISLKLCSDTAGATPVNTIDIPALTTLNQWTVVTVDLATNLGNSIQSIGFYVNTDNGAQAFLLSNIIACKASSAADSLTLSSLISKNRSDDTWYGIQSINGTRVMLDQNVNGVVNTTNNRGYYHPSGTETVTTYKRETIKTVPTTGTTNVQQLTDIGTSGNLIAIEGGWDRTNMSTQTLETWYDGSNGLGTGFTLANYCSTNKVSGVRYNTFMTLFAPVGILVTNCHGNNNSGITFSFVYGSVQTDNNTITDCFAVCNSNAGFNFAFGNGIVTNIYASNNSSNGVTLTGLPNGIVTNVDSYNNVGSGIGYSGAGGLGINNARLINCDSAFNVSAGIDFGNSQNATATNCTATSNGTVGFLVSQAGLVFLRNCTTTSNSTASFQTNGGQIIAYNSVFNESTELFVNNLQYRNIRMQSQNHDNVAGNHRIFADYGLIVADTTTRHTASGFSWKMSPTSSVYRTSTYPLDFSLAKVAVAANALVTIKAWMYRDNSGLTMRLVCKGGQIAGVPNDVVSTVSATGSWEEETITFTPTEAGVVEIIAEAYGGSTFNGWVDDMTITQA